MRPGRGPGPEGRTPVGPGRRTGVSLGGPTRVVRRIPAGLIVAGLTRAGLGCRRTRVSPARVRSRTRRSPEVRLRVSPGPTPPASRTGRRTRPPIRICGCRRRCGNRRTRAPRRQGRHLGLSRHPGRGARPVPTCTARPRWPGRSDRLPGHPASPPSRGPKSARRPRRTTGHRRHRHHRRRRGGRSGDGADHRARAASVSSGPMRCRGRTALDNGVAPWPSPRWSAPRNDGRDARSGPRARHPVFRVRQTDLGSGRHWVPDTVEPP